jgi:citrate synthase
MSRSTTSLASKAQLHFKDKTIELPLLEGTEGELAIDVGELRQRTGLITLDPGFVNTGSCSSDITFVDGEKGILRYRGYPIEELATKRSFLECAWLLLHGELPNPDELATLQAEVRAESTLPEALRAFFREMPRAGHPMGMLGSLVGALTAFTEEPRTAEEQRCAIVRLIAQLPMLAAAIYRHSIGEPRVELEGEQDYASSFLHLMFGSPGQAPDVDPVAAKALDLLLVLHADHEQNCSTSAVRLVGSSKSHLYGAIAAGIFALWGPLHGGANQAVVEMLEDIESGGGSATEFLERAKDKGDTTRLMGFGHRVYKSYDPRAKILKGACEDVLQRQGGSSKLLEIAMELEGITLKDEYFVSRSLYPNVDFYSGVIYKSLGIPTNMFTVMFALGRLPGWIAQWQEMRTSSEFRIGRPRQLYTGSTQRSI